MVVVTHEMGFARRAANRVVFMADGEIVEDAEPDEFFDNPEVRPRQGLPRQDPRPLTASTQEHACRPSNANDASLKVRALAAAVALAVALPPGRYRLRRR